MGSTSSSPSPPSRRPRPRSPFLRELLAALEAEARADVDLAARIGVLRAAGVRRSEIPAQLGIDAAHLRPAYRLLSGAARRMAGDATQPASKSGGAG